MRSASIRLAFLGLTLATLASALDACGDYNLKPDSIPFPGITAHAVLHGDHLVCVNDTQRQIVVDLKNGMSFDLGKHENGRWLETDVADGLALVRDKDRLRAVALMTGKIVHDIDLGKERVITTGFAGKGKAFVHRGRTLDVVELKTAKTLHTIQLGDSDMGRGGFAWQKVGNRLFVGGPETTICVIDLQAGKLHDRFSVDSSAGIGALHVEGSLVYCVGVPFSWVPNSHLFCYDMESKKNFFSQVSRSRFHGRIAGAPYGTAYICSGNTIERITMTGERCGTFTAPGTEPVLGVWRNRALVSVKDEIRLLEIKETPIARK